MTAINLSPVTQKLLSERMNLGGYDFADDAVHAALLALNDADTPSDKLDAGTIEAIEEANAQIERGEGIPLEEAFQRLRSKLLGK